MRKLKRCAAGTALLALLLACALLFAGCKITFPEKQAVSSDASASGTLSSEDASSMVSVSGDSASSENTAGNSSQPSSGGGGAAGSSSTDKKPAAPSSQTASGGKAEQPVSSAPPASSSGNAHSSESAPAAKQVCYLAIDCKTAAAKEEYLAKYDERILPRDGVILARTAVEFTEGETVCDILLRVAKAHGIVISKSGRGSFAYIRGIGGLMEFGCGNSSGWLYQVNGALPGIGVDVYKVKAGDAISFRYTVERGDVS